MRRVIQTLLLTPPVVFSLCVVCGCQEININHIQSAEKKLLAPPQPSLDAVQLDIVYVERDAEDPLMGKLIWNDVDQIGTIDLKTRARMRQSGFRIGLVGMTPPPSLQRLLGFKNDITDEATTSRHNEMTGRHVVLRSGGETEIQTNYTVAEMKMLFPGEIEERNLTNARTVLRAELERLQDGWVNLHLTPEIHYGESQLRPVAGASNFELKGAQEIHAFHDLKFSVTLNVGEMIVLSADLESEDKTANMFFVNSNTQRPRRNLVAIRLTGMKKIEPLYSEVSP